MKKYMGLTGVQKILEFLKTVTESFSEAISEVEEKFAAAVRHNYKAAYGNGVFQSSNRPKAEQITAGAVGFNNVKIGDTISLTHTPGNTSTSKTEITVTNVTDGHVMGDSDGFMFMGLGTDMNVYKFYRDGQVWFVELERLKDSDDDGEELPYKPVRLEDTPPLEELLEYPLGTQFPYTDPRTGNEEWLTLRSWQYILQQPWCNVESALAAVCTDTSMRCYLMFYNDGNPVAYIENVIPFDLTAETPAQLVW